MATALTKTASEIREDIATRLATVTKEKNALEAALQALDADTTPEKSAPKRSRRVTRARSSRRGSRQDLVQAATDAVSETNGAHERNQGTKDRILDALSDSNPQTAGDIAGVTGLGRASVSTQLSKLAKAGDVKKADRGLGYLRH